MPALFRQWLFSAQRVAELGRAGEAQAAQLQKLEQQLAEVQGTATALAARLERAARLHANLQNRRAHACVQAAVGLL